MSVASLKCPKRIGLCLGQVPMFHATFGSKEKKKLWDLFRIKIKKGLILVILDSGFLTQVNSVVSLSGNCCLMPSL
jgi:hypothetical protein